MGKRVSLFIFLILGAVVFGACSKKDTPKLAVFNFTGEMPSQESWRATVTFSDSGNVRAVLFATHAAIYEEKRVTLIDSGLVVDFYNTRGEHTSKLTAREGRVNDATNDLEAINNVVFTSDSGTVVHTEYLFWDNAKKKVRSDKFVTVDSPKEHLQGYGFEAEQDLKNYVIFRVSGRAEVKND
jgi:LPS export ABC transporter protein LptC